jgi:membrane associated rhomboid family serine protease
MTKTKNDLSNTIGNLPWATIIIIAANVIMTLVARRDFHNFALDYGLVPSMLRVGRFITSGFIHDGFAHLGMNMLLLYIFGGRMERAMGRLEFGLFYIGACFASSLLHVAIVYASLPPYYATRAVVGASGAVAGVMGLYAVRFHRNRFKIDGMEVSALFLILIWLLLQVGFGILALYRDDILGLRLRYVAYWSHLGGFTFGIIVAMISNMALQGEREYLISKGKQNYDQGNLLESAHNFESLLKYDPDNALAHAELGRLWAIMEEEGQSLPYYREAVRLYIREGHEDKAIAAAQEMKRFWPEFTLSPAERFRLASYLEEVGQPEHAIAAFQEIAENSPTSNEAQMSLLKIGQLQLISLKDPVSTINTLTSFLQLYPDSEWRLFVEETLVRAGVAG